MDCVCVCVMQLSGMWLFHVSSYKRLYFPGSIRYWCVCVCVAGAEIKKMFPFFSSVPLGEKLMKAEEGLISGLLFT